MQYRFPPAPKNWHSTIQDLFEEVRLGKRSSIGPDEIEWAGDYERSRLPDGVRYPKRGDIYRACTDLEVTFLTHWRNPFTSDGEGLLLAGESVLIDSDPIDRPIAVYASPIELAIVERRLVPAKDREAPGYDGMHLSLRTIDLITKFQLVTEE